MVMLRNPCFLLKHKAYIVGDENTVLFKPGRSFCSKRGRDRS